MDESKKRKDTVSMKDAIDSFLKASGLEEKYIEQQVILKWEELVGKPIALRTDSIQIQNKTLILKMNSSVMRDELFHQKSKIIEIINQEAGFEIVNDIFLK